LLVVLLLFPIAAVAKERRGVESGDCTKVAAGQTLKLKTDTLLNQRENLRAYATLDLERDSGDATGKFCIATYSLYVSERTGGFKLVRNFSGRIADRAGADIVGFSDNGLKLAADFWWATGFYVAHRPVIYDSKAKIARLSALEDKITSQLPACNYAENFTGVTNAGDAVFHVPAASAAQGCGDQGDWLLDVRTGEAQRKP
jgi:hypothetical protein